MARGKKAKTGGKSRGTSRRGQDRSHQRASDLDSPDDLATKSFSLRDAARNSEHHGKYWSSSGTQLRHQSMSFVRSTEPPPNADEVRNTSEKNSKVGKEERNQRPKEDHHSDFEPSDGLVVADSHGLDQTQVDITSSASYVETPSSPSTTSDDEVVFAGRKIQSSPHIAEEPRPASTRPRVAELRSLSTQYIPDSTADDPFDHHNDFVALNIRGSDKKSDAKPPQKRRKRSGRRSWNATSDVGVDAALDDYIENMRHNEDTDTVNLEIALGTDKDGWASSDLQDFDLMSTSDEVMETVIQVISKRERPSGVQYLVVWEDRTVDEACWILHTSLPLAASTLIAEFEERQQGLNEQAVDDGDDSDTEDDDVEIEWGTDEDLDKDGDIDVDDFEDERDLIERRMQRMTDEHIARLLQKQETLGIYSSDLEIFDGEDDGEMTDQPLPSRSSRSRRKASQKRSKDRSQPGFAFAAEDIDLMLEGDDYGNFDPMDRERTSIMKGDGSNRNPFTFDLSDSDMAVGLQVAWETDRRKKKAKKEEREALRAQGLLGRNRSVPDLKARYNEGMSLGHLEQELEAFLFSDQQQLALPPLDKRDRKVIHDIASKFGLSSKSQGAGKKRFPVLHKTKRTIDFDDALFGKLKGQLNRRFFSRMDVRSKGKGPAPFKRGGGGSRPDIGYREGEIVGASAPEIGVENRGRAMLEKMGWSMGTALGTLNNQGILKPIEHIVKNSKAGLG